MHNILKEILLQKQKEAALLKKNFPDLREKALPRNFRKEKSLKIALKTECLSVIAEIKRKSPSKGEMAVIKDPVSLALEYVAGGANAISVLTDRIYFGGSLQDMTDVSKALKDVPCPILRKDFIIDEFQICEAVMAGADAVLLIVAALGNRTHDFIEFAKKMNVETLVEVHTKDELAIAVESGAEIIGVNNRDLTTFQVDIARSLELVKFMPKDAVKVAESGVSTVESAKKLKAAGFDAILAGEALVRSSFSSQLITQLKTW